MEVSKGCIWTPPLDHLSTSQIGSQMGCPEGLRCGYHSDRKSKWKFEVGPKWRSQTGTQDHEHMYHHYGYIHHVHTV